MADSTVIDADKIATEIIGDWIPNISDSRSLVELVSEGVRRGHSLGLGVTA